VCAFVDNHGTTGVLEVPRPSPLLAALQRCNRRLTRRNVSSGF
jgi:hypothetical protein